MFCKKRKFRKKAAVFFTVALSAVVLFTACKSSDSSSDSSSEDSSSSSVELVDYTIDTTSVIDPSDQFTDRDMEQDYDASEAETITLADGASESSSSSVEIDGDTITITESGVYVISGTLSDGQIVVNGEDIKVQLVLDGVSISNDSSACIYVPEAKKVFITTAEGSENSLTVSGDYVQTDDNNIDGVIFAKSNLTLNGTGALTVTGMTGHGIVCKDDLAITGGTISVTSSDHAISGKDSVRICGGTLDLTSDEDGIHSGNDDDDTVGWVYISGGTIQIAVGDDGIHADLEVRIDGGTVNVTKSYEGIEGEVINVTDGTITVVSSDDGFNSAGGSDTTESGTQDRFAQGPAGDTDDSAQLNFYGGTVTVTADGDGLDSNGSLLVAGGTIYISGPTNDGNGALDYGTEAAVTGGTVIAAGSSGMAEGFGDSSTQGSILLNLSSSETGTVTLTDSDGNVLAEFTPERQYTSVVVSCSGITDGSSYTLTCGDSSTDITMDGIVYSSGSSQSQGGQMQGGQMPGGQSQSGQMPGGGQKPDTSSEQ